ncbi:ketoacyl-ACP synthase III [Corallococcus sp. BB11-1]|uniref:beta-ketoacyl-ACP synthase III n=1 Tax=Corallococcus sp. BB11-1 TaxID=2996783 RepID=UPI00226F4D20|nr:beta-ketoacyl-ACP synthase III [Corallococcus sp. BB11-1]MCY1033267.1 ketoacyl-ACP synthase III [Corallococcus sp. BB11-1]
MSRPLARKVKEEVGADESPADGEAEASLGLEFEDVAPRGRRAARRPSVVAVLDGLGIAMPPRVMDNHEFASRLETSDEWIQSRTGIVERRIAGVDIATSDLAVEAGRAALRQGRGWGGEACAVVVATTTPDHPMPGVAPLVAARLGLATPAAFDVQAACSGFVYALAAGAGLISGGIAERVLVIGAEVMSRIVDANDRSTAVLFGDGAGAVCLRAGSPDEPGAVGPFDLGSDGEHARQLFVEAGGSRMPVTQETGGRRFLRMDGGHVYRHAVRRMSESSLRLLERANLEVDQIDRFVAHQANTRILNAVADRLGIPPARRVINVDRCGNTSAASIPLALAHAMPRPGERILITAFGSGFTWGSTYLTWPDLGKGSA